MNFLMIFFKFDKSHLLRNYTTITDEKTVKELFFANCEGKN